MKIFLVLILLQFSGIAASNTYEAGVNIGSGYVPRNNEDLGKGSYNYSGLYFIRSNHRFDVGVMKDSEACNESHNRISYSRYFKANELEFLFGMEFLDLNRNYDSEYDFLGAQIYVPIPYIGYRKYIFNSTLKVNTELLIHINRIGVSLNIGF